MNHFALIQKECKTSIFTKVFRKTLHETFRKTAIVYVIL